MVLPIEFLKSGLPPTASPDHAVIASAAPTGTNAPDIEILDVTKQFGAVTAVDAMTLRIARGAFYSFLGLESRNTTAIPGPAPARSPSAASFGQAIVTIAGRRCNATVATASPP